MPYTYTYDGNTQEFDTEERRNEYKRRHLGIINQIENKRGRVDARLAFDWEAERLHRDEEN